MCGRYASFLPAEFIARLFATINPLPNLAPTWNMAPTMDAPIVRLIYGNRHLDALTWGLVPSFTKELKKARKPVNARSETIAKWGMFKAAFAAHRCLVPAPAYEWPDDPDGKTPFAVARIDGDPVAFGGIWEQWQSPTAFATITTDVNRRRPSRLACRDHRTAGLAAVAGRSPRRSHFPAAARTRGRPAGLAGRESRRQLPERRTRTTRAINCYGADPLIMSPSRLAGDRTCNPTSHHLKGARPWRTTTYPERI